MTTDDNGGLWLTVSDLARQKGIDKAAISRRISRFEADGQLSTRAGARGSKLVNLAEYERVAGQHLDIGRVQAEQTKAVLKGESASGSADPVLSREQARRVAYQADLARLDLGERTGRLVPVDRIEAEAQRLIEPIAKSLDRLPSHTDAILAAHNESGGHGVRTYLKGLVAQIRNDMARAAATLASEIGAEPRRALEDFYPNPGEEAEDIA